MKTNLLRTLGLVTLLVITSAAHAENFYSIGVGGGITPRYTGSRDYRPVFTPILGATFDNGFFASSLEGIGYTKTFSNGLYVKGTLNYDLGRTDSNSFEKPGSNHLAGMGDIPGALVFSAEAGFHVFGPSTLSLAIDTPLTHTANGVAAHVDFTSPLIETGSDSVSVVGSVHGGTARYMQTWYGVTAAQSDASGFRAYTSKAGIDNVSASLKWSHAFSAAWSVTSSAQITRLVGKAGNSPIVQSKSGYSLLTSVNYRF